MLTAAAMRRGFLRGIVVANNSVFQNGDGALLLQTRCFANPAGLDFSPFPGSLLVGPGVVELSGALPKEDFFGFRRAVSPTVGAIERLGRPLRLDPPL